LDEWVIKGGYALQRRLPQARYTIDLDLSTSDTNLQIADRPKQQLELTARLQQIARHEIDDYFYFEVEFDSPLPGFGKGGARCRVKCSIDGQLWSTFQIDVIVQDETIFPAEIVEGDILFRFAGLKPIELKVPAKEEVFAEKIHAYTLPRSRENTRVKDIIDMSLLIEDNLDPRKLRKAITGIFKIRHTHKVPTNLPKPPDSWQNKFTQLADEACLKLTLKDAYTKTKTVYDRAMR